MTLLRNPKVLLLPVVLLLVLAVAPRAGAERACREDNPLMKCPVEVCIALQDDVNRICKPKPKACQNTTGCFNLRQTRQRFLDCYAARSRINVTCWDGGDPRHQAEQIEAIEQVYVCEARMRLPEPIGCADPCPFDDVGALRAEDRVACAARGEEAGEGEAPEEERPEAVGSPSGPEAEG